MLFGPIAEHEKILSSVPARCAGNKSDEACDLHKN
jgi:hypothetical protein